VVQLLSPWINEGFEVTGVRGTQPVQPAWLFGRTSSANANSERHSFGWRSVIGAFEGAVAVCGPVANDTTGQRCVGAEAQTRIHALATSLWHRPAKWRSHRASPRSGQSPPSCNEWAKPCVEIGMDSDVSND